MNSPWYVVGGGIVGLLCARELRLAGESVVVLDRQTVGKESSWAGGGILSPLYPWRCPDAVSILSSWSQEHYPGIAQDLKLRSGIDSEWTASGLLYFGVKDPETAAVWASTQGVKLEEPDQIVVERIAPLAVGRLDSALWMPHVAQIRNPRLLAALCVDLRQSGVKFYENTQVIGFTARQDRLMSIQTNSGEIETHRCLVTAGVWSGELLATIGMVLPISPVKGQMLLLSAQSLRIKTMILKDNRYIIPRRDGRVLVGSTLESTGYEKSTTEVARDELMQAAVNIIPALASCTIEGQWAGLRPGTPTGVPYISEHPKVEGLFVCAGHFRNGIVMAPASARLVVDIMLGRTPSFDKEQFRVPLA